MVCPVEAIRKTPNVTGKWYISSTDSGPMVHARLGIAGKIPGGWWRRCVGAPRNWRGVEASLILGDGPRHRMSGHRPVSGADLVLIVTEPTVSACMTWSGC